MIAKYEDCFKDSYRDLMENMRLPVYPNRKRWEYWRIAETVFRYVKAKNPKGVGFGVGKEHLPEFFASLGHKVLCTDGPVTDTTEREWQGTGQHASRLDDLHHGLIPLDAFNKRATFREVDMLAIPKDIKGYDYCWSAGSLEHLGSLQAGLDFIERSLDCLKPGGWSVHATEFNLASIADPYCPTVEGGSFCFYRTSDLQTFADRMTSLGHNALPFVFEQGKHPENFLPDVHPYPHGETHMSLIAAGHHVTSVLIAIQKK
jgi:hypothetical protein